MRAMSAESIDDLFAKTLTGDYDDDAPWAAVSELRRIGSREILDRAEEWCRSEDPLVRARGADVLAQIGKTADHPSNSFPNESYSAVSNLLRQEEDTRPLASAIYALGHIDNPDAVPLVLAYGSHSDANVREAVAFALGSFPNDPHSVKFLLLLLRDTDEDVRDWATFTLGVLSDADSEEVREALVGCLNDSLEDVREEAIAGLAKRNDLRVLPSLLAALEDECPTYRVIDTAHDLLKLDRGGPPNSAEVYAAALRARFAFELGVSQR